MIGGDRDAGLHGGVRLLLRLEGLALFVAAAAMYFYLARGEWGNGWPLFLALILAPDLAMLGYLAGPAIGAVTYNAAHITPGPLALAALGYFAGVPVLISLALIWAAHIGMDRALGYGLKYPEGFRFTHLGRLGRDPSARPRGDG